MLLFEKKNSSFLYCNRNGKVNKMTKNTSGKSLTAIMAAVVVVVLGLGVWAVAPIISENVKENQQIAAQQESYEKYTRVSSGASNVGEMADLSGMEVEDFLALYGVADAGFNGDTAQADFDAKITLAKYAEFYNGAAPTEEEWAEFKTAKELGDDVTMDTLDTTVKSDYIAYVAEKKAAEEAAAAETEAIPAEDVVVESEETAANTDTAE